MLSKDIKVYKEVLKKLRTDPAVNKHYYRGCRDMFYMIYPKAKRRRNG